APVPDEHDTAETKSCVQVANDVLNGRVVHAVPRPNVMRNRPTRDHHHAHNDLDIVWLAVSAVTVFGNLLGSGTLEVSAGDVVEHQIGPEAEEITQAMVQRHLDSLFGPVELIERAIPGLQLGGMRTNASVLVPLRHESAAFAVTDKVGLQPAGDPVLTGRIDEAIGHEHKGPVGQRHVFGSPQRFVEDLPEAELVEQGPYREDRPPSRSIHNLGIGQLAGVESLVPSEQALESRQHLDQEVLPTEVGDDALLDLAVLAVGLDDADVLVDGAVGGADSDRTGVQGGGDQDAMSFCRGEFPAIRPIPAIRLSLRFSALQGHAPLKHKDLRSRVATKTWNMG